jgi:hypothetical protein
LSFLQGVRPFLRLIRVQGLTCAGPGGFRINGYYFVQREQPWGVSTDHRLQRPRGDDG